jgi:hypothetical protein
MPTKIETAVAILSRSARGITPAMLQEQTDMSRRLSSWDMKRLAKIHHRKVVKFERVDGSIAYRLAPRG